MDEIYLTENFTLAELTYSETAIAQGIDNTPDELALAELQLTAELLEEIRSILGNYPIWISSGFRCPALNEAIGGAENSAHLYGAAADFTVPDFGTPLEVCRALEPYLSELEIDQLIHENDSWIHIGRPIAGEAARCECLTIDGESTIYGLA